MRQAFGVPAWSGFIETGATDPAEAATRTKPERPGPPVTKKTIQIFRAGSHVGMDGKTYDFTDADVQAIADVYSPATFSAPAVIGHPKHDDPAYGWATAMRVEDGVLVADLERIDPAFADLVEKGRYAKISTSFYAPTSKNNPAPGSYYPRHIGFLGAAAPGCQGLAPVAFADGDDEFVEFAIDERLRPIVWLAKTVARLVRRQREQLIEDKGVEEANKLMSEWEADAPAEIAAELEQAFVTDGARFAEPADAADPAITNADIAAAELASREAAIAAREQVMAARDAAFAEGQRQARVDEDAAFLAGLIAEGRLPPGLTPQFAAFCEALGESDAIAFAEGETPQDPRAAFKALLSANLGTVIRFDEIAGGEGVKFAEGQSADELASAARERVADARARGESLSVSAAMTAITAGR